MNLDPRLYLDSHVVVWLARVGEWQPFLAGIEPLLDSRERERAGRFHFAEDRARFIMGRGLLREMAAPFLMREPAEIEIGYTERDRPVFVGERKTQFSIAHSGDIVALALTAHARVGIDVEFMRRDLDPLELAPRIFSEAALIDLRNLPAAGQRPAFFRAWTRKEAYLKARGEGIAEALTQVGVPLTEVDVMNVHDARDPSVQDEWLVRSLPVGDDYSGSVAYENPAKRGDVFQVRSMDGNVTTERDVLASW